jgi:hypothetical protein
MRHLRVALIALAGTFTVVPAVVATAQPYEYGPRVYRERGVSEPQARYIARQEGIRYMDSARRADNGDWVVEGEDARGYRMRVRIDPFGRVVDVR